MQKDKIVVDRQSVDYLIKQREDLVLRELTPEERRQTIDAFVEDEILYTEAYKRRLDKGDSRMRRNLILKMRGLRVGLDSDTLGEALGGFGRSLPRMSQRHLVGAFGAESARAILAIADNQWHGPFESIRGVHFVRVVDRSPARRPTWPRNWAAG